MHDHRCPHCGKPIHDHSDWRLTAALLLIGTFILYGISYAQGWLP